MKLSECGIRERKIEEIYGNGEYGWKALTALLHVRIDYDLFVGLGAIKDIPTEIKLEDEKRP